MDSLEESVGFKIVKELPRTKRNLEEQARREAEEKEREERMRLQKQLSEEQQQRLRAEEWEKEKHKQEMERKRLLEEQKRKEEEEQRGTLEGRLAKLINDLAANSTGIEFSVSGIEMGSVRWRILADALEKNSSLRDLHMSRKEIEDEDGVEIIKSLKPNTTINKLELEGNRLGVQTAVEIGDYLKKNQTLKYLDLEGNGLVDEAKDSSGINQIAEGIKVNSRLLVLNLSYCNLDETCGRTLAAALKENQTLIQLDVRGNDLPLEVMQEITASLEKNKQKFNEERMEEWKERKQMKKEDEYMEMIDITLQQEHLKKMNILNRQEAAKKDKEARLEEEKLKAEYEMKRDMEKLMNNAKKRAESGKKKKKSKKKKK